MPKTLLLADDSPTIQRVVTLSFAGHDVVVVPVGDGDQAVEALKTVRPDVVIADVAMPGRSGYDVADYIRQSAELSGIPVLLLASAFEPVDSARVQAVGARGLLTKPFAPAAIVGRVRELLGNPWPAQPHSVDLPSQSDSASPLGKAAEDAYFDQIDRAFAELKTRHPQPPAPPVHSQEKTPSDDALMETPAPLQHAAGKESLTFLRPAAVSLPDAFSAMLAAESGEVAPEQLSQGILPGAAVDNDALVEQVIARAVATMSERIVRETVTDIVSATAERLVREEIERIKRELG